VKPDVITLARRYLATVCSWLAIAIMALYISFKAMPLLGIHGSMKMGLHAAISDHAMASLGNAFNFHLSIHLNYPK
jgi:hypothetical protein